MTPLFSVTGLSHRYVSTAVLDLSHWEVAAGNHQFVIGPSGSGKTGTSAPQAGLLGLLILEGVTLTAAGVILCLSLGYLGAEVIDHWLADARQVEFYGALWVKEELWLVLAALGPGVMSAQIAATSACIGDIALTLSQRLVSRDRLRTMAHCARFRTHLIMAHRRFRQVECARERHRLLPPDRLAVGEF